MKVSVFHTQTLIINCASTDSENDPDAEKPETPDNLKFHESTPIVQAFAENVSLICDFLKNMEVLSCEGACN